jgi:flagellar motor component MotA
MDDTRMAALEAKLDKIMENVVDLKVAQAAHTEVQKKHNESLDEHMRRTDLLEQQIKPLETKAAMIEGAFKLIGGLAVGVGIIQGLMSLMEHIRNVK